MNYSKTMLEKGQVDGRVLTQEELKQMTFSRVEKNADAFDIVESSNFNSGGLANKLASND